MRLRRLSPVTWLVALTAIIIITFVGSTILVERNASRIDERAAVIADHSTPDITALSAARTEMRHLELGVGRYLGARIGGLPFDRGQLYVWRAGVDQHLEQYAHTPFFPDERGPYSRLGEVKARLYGELDRVINLIDADRIVEARAHLFKTIQSDGEEIDRLIAELININNRHAAESARQMRELRRNTSVLAVLLDAVSVVLGGLLLFGAVRAARLYQRALEEQRRLAETRASELGHFAARVAHDLKAPLASVMLGSSLAVARPAETQRALEKIQRTSRLMGEMIDALLSIARAEPLPPQAPATCVAPVLDVLIDEVRPAAEAAGATLCVEPFSATATVGCSAGVLASVLSNILHNAVKYIGGATGERHIVVRVAERGTVTRIEVADTGPGLPPELEQRVFERYVRGAESTGLGLGLATVKRLVEGTGGRLGVETAAGKGSCFWFELPCAATAARQASELRVGV